MELKKFMELKKYFEKLTGKKEQPVPSGIENIVLAAAHQYFMQLPHSYLVIHFGYLVLNYTNFNLQRK